MVSRYRRFTATKVENIFISSKFFINKKFVKVRQNRKLVCKHVDFQRITKNSSLSFTLAYKIME